MPSLLLGPILRYASGSEATVWVETSAPCRVGILGATARTFEVDGHHYAVVHVTGLEPESDDRHYHVDLDGERTWPEPDSVYPPSTIRKPRADGACTLAFGSCRMTLPHEPPFTLSNTQDPRGHGIDALRALALRMSGSAPESWPDALLMLGDQVYADDLSPTMEQVTASRAGTESLPPDKLCGFSEFALAYREAWSEPAIRWLLSTVPTLMVFDDHELHAEWKISQQWLEEKRRQPWYEQRVTEGLMAYWLYQHLGNLTPDELSASDLLERVRAADDGAEVLRAFARDADQQAGSSRWSFSRDLGRSRLIVVDSRAGRELAPPPRRMVSDEEWAWLEERAEGGFDHLLLASSVPFLLGPGLHHLEAWNEAVCEGAWGERAARLGERVRRSAVLDHWASFQYSFRRLTDLVEAVVTGRLGAAPKSLLMLSGDVHHSYLAEVGFRPGLGADSPVWQVVCSPFRKELARKEKRAMRFANSRVGAAIGRLLARTVNARKPALGWRLDADPSYENHVATLDLTASGAELRIETTAGSDWRQPELRLELKRLLA